MEFNLSFKWGGKKKKSVGQIQNTEAVQPVTPVIEVVTDRSITAEELERKMDEAIQRAFREADKKWAGEFDTAQLNMPIQAGRTSIYEGDRNGNMLENSPVHTNFDFRVLQFLANLSIWNRHVSQAVDNIVTFGNTDYDIDFGESVGVSQANEMRKFLWEQVKGWYEFADGEDSLDNDLLSQLSTYGAISAETVIGKDLRSIQSVVRVNPFYVRFAHDRALNKHVPLQEIGGVQNVKLKTKYPGYIELNTNTYHYIGMRRISEMPYAIPPFCSALEDIMTQNDMVANFKNMMRRLGMLGFLSVLLKAPQPVNGEHPDGYSSRLQKYLEDVRPSVEKGFSRGIAIGFKDSHEFEIQGSNLNSANAENLMKVVKSLVFAGVKQDPNMHGENYSTTETFGRVILEKMTAQVINYQKPLATFKSRIFQLALLLNGYRVDQVNIKYHRPSTHDEKREQEVRKMKQENLRADYEDGLISQEQRANLLGYDKPDQAEPRVSKEEKIAEKKLAAKGTGSKESNFERIKKKLNSGLPEFDYFVPEQSSPLSLITVGDFPDPRIRAFLSAYLTEADDQFKKAVEKSYRPIRAELAQLPDAASLQTVQAAFMYGLYSSMERNFADPIQSIVEDNIEPIYSFYRKDKSVFEDGVGFGRARTSLFIIPDALFDLVDARAIQFLEDIDRMYLGKFITDADTERRILRWLQEKFEKGDVPIGRNSTLIAEFMQEFGSVVMHESWKIRRIIETTVNRSRNIGNVFYLNQAKIVTYEIIEVMDDKTCGWCRHMNAKRFDVKQTVDQYEDLFNKGVEKTPQVTPFATKFKLDEFVKMDSKLLRANGVTLPSFHPLCRGRVVAFFKN